MSRRRILPSLSSSRQMMIAWKVSGLSQSPAIIASRPASMRLAMAISPSRERSSTDPISRRYMRTGSSVRSAGSEVRVATAVVRGASTISPASGSSSSSGVSFSASSASSLSTTLMPISLSIAFMSSIWSEEISSEGRTALSSSWVTQPRFLATFSIRLTAASLRSRSGLSGVSTAAAAASPSTFASSFFAISVSVPSRGGCAGFKVSSGPRRRRARPFSILKRRSRP